MSREKRIFVMTIICAATLAGAALASETITYTYDAKGRVVKIERAGTVNNNIVANYSYDHADNRVNVNVSGAP